MRDNNNVTQLLFCIVVHTNCTHLCVVRFCNNCWSRFFTFSPSQCRSTHCIYSTKLGQMESSYVKAHYSFVFLCIHTMLSTRYFGSQFHLIINISRKVIVFRYFFWFVLIVLYTTRNDSSCPYVKTLFSQPLSLSSLDKYRRSL